METERARVKTKKSLKVGIVRFPGSNCDFDTLKFFEKFGHRPRFIWYKETKLPALDMLILPGGFAFGDRVYKKATARYVIDPGTQAITSPVMRVVRAAAKKGLPILGICNGFQVLVKAGFLPGRLERNTSGRFFCDLVTCEVTGNSFFGDRSLLDKSFVIPVAHGYGRYIIHEGAYQDLLKNGQIFLRYMSFNPNGSLHNIAGVSNKNGTIFGMMPHPERSPHGNYFMRAIENYLELRNSNIRANPRFDPRESAYM